MEWHFFDKVYRRYLMVLISDFDTFKKELEFQELNDLDEVTLTKGRMVHIDDSNSTGGSRFHIIWMNKYDEGTLVHELSHFVMCCFDDIQVPISLHNQETYAYYLEYWFKEIRRVRRRWPKGRKPQDAQKHL